MSASLAVPASPASSKRSRSRDSARSAATSSIDTSTGTGTGTPYFTPQGSAANLPLSDPASDHGPTPYPAFLRLSRPGIQRKFIDLEWEQRRRLSPTTENENEQPSQWAKCSGEHVTIRNRYANVDPYQNNRVRLKVPEGRNDYINASPIELTTTKSNTVLRYIATQGPKNDTTSHFWRMVWHETTSPSVVVMLTQTHEAAREKCYPYYPQANTSEIRLNPQDEYEDGFIHDLKLVTEEKHEEARAQIRRLHMCTEDGSETRSIWHLLFAGWPDFLVPEGSDRAALLKLIEISREKNPDLANPRIVHCSAGVGRSGTFIALDWLLQELREGSLDELPDDVDPIISVVDTLRQQRMMMVQGEAQLTFIYEVLREQWRLRWIQRHPEEADRLGVTAVQSTSDEAQGPRLKRQKSGPSEPSSQIEVDEDERTELEAELMESDIDFDKGKK